MSWPCHPESGGQGQLGRGEHRHNQRCPVPRGQPWIQPYCRIANLVEANIAARHTASAYLKELARLGILEEEKVGRDKLFLHRKYIDVLFGEEHDFEPYPTRAVAHA